MNNLIEPNVSWPQQAKFITSNKIVGRLLKDGRTYTAINEANYLEPYHQFSLTQCLETCQTPPLSPAIIMCLRNISTSFKNGTRLRVTAYSTEA